jgi:hypothetical protein
MMIGGWSMGIETDEGGRAPLRCTPLVSCWMPVMGMRRSRSGFLDPGAVDGLAHFGLRRMFPCASASYQILNYVLYCY